MNKQTPHSYWYITCLILGGFLLSSCGKDVSPYNLDHMEHIDNQSHQLITDRLKEEAKKIFKQQQDLQTKISAVKSVAQEPKPIEPVFDPLDAVTVSIDVDDCDVQDVLRALADQAGMSLLLDPELSELKRKISMHLQDVPASMVFNSVMKLLNLSGAVKNNVMIIRPFEERLYNLDFIQSTATMNFNIGGDVFGANSSSGTGDSSGISSDNGMSGNLTMANTGSKYSDAYAELDKMLLELIGKKTDSSAKKGQPGVNTQGENKEQSEEQPLYALNRMTGTLYVRAHPSQIDMVSKLIHRYKQVLERQILIEAQILDVSLNEQYQYGVDWSVLGQNVVATYGNTVGSLSGVEAQLPIVDVPTRTVTLPASDLGSSSGRSLGAMYSEGRFTSAINMLQMFGTVRVLSNPSIRAKNAHPAFISVGKSSQYISKSSSSVTNVGGGATTTSADVTTSSVFDGIVLGVEPFIADDGKISLTIHPMQSAVDSDSLTLIDAGGGNKVTLPVIDFKGMTTALSMSSGDTVILGGLIDEIGSDTGDGIPGLTDVPLLGSLFGSRSHKKTARELIIVLRVSRVNEPDL
ncbi:MAG: pilus (MSHA type) biogenesis protein MshL [Desulforhopalus sp.]|nr:pilus (MSHA type) biogenesis protein MshL [Desulforhopalus sp.]